MSELYIEDQMHELHVSFCSKHNKSGFQPLINEIEEILDCYKEENQINIDFGFCEFNQSLMTDGKNNYCVLNSTKNELCFEFWLKNFANVYVERNSLNNKYLRCCVEKIDLLDYIKYNIDNTIPKTCETQRKLEYKFNYDFNNQFMKNFKKLQMFSILFLLAVLTFFIISKKLKCSFSLFGQSIICYAFIQLIETCSYVVPIHYVNELLYTVDLIGGGDFFEPQEDIDMEMYKIIRKLFMSSSKKLSKTWLVILTCKTHETVK